MRKRAMTDAAQAVLDDLGFNLPAAALLSDLTIGQQQLVRRRARRCAAPSF